MRPVLLAYAVSGFISLGYQVAWFRILTDRYGSTNFTFALVVTCFIGGLALGAAASRPVTAWASPRLSGLRLYGAIELAVALSIGIGFAAGAVPADLLGSFPYGLREGVWQPALSLRALQVTLAVATVLVPCFFMGVTFPLLCDLFRGAEDGARFPSRLYAVNTLGACLGVLACEFLLLPRVGQEATLLVMALANAALGLWFLARPAAARGHSLASPVSSASATTPGSLLLLAGFSGFAAGALEADLFKRVSFAIEIVPGATPSFVSFWAVLAIFAASALVRRSRRLSLRGIFFAFPVAALYCALAWAGVDGLRDAVEGFVVPTGMPVASDFEGMRSQSFPSSLVQLWVFVGVLVAPPYFAVSLLLPAVCNEIQRRGGHLGWAYGTNTLGFCAGFLAFMLVVPLFGNLFHAFKLFLVAFGGASLWLLFARTDGAAGALRPALLMAFLVAAWLLVPRDFDPAFFRPESPPARAEARGVRSDGANTTFVIEVGGYPQLYFGRMQMSATHPRAQTYMRLMAHFPLLLHPQPERALLLCLGVGNTGAAIAQHPSIERIDVLDLNEQVMRTLPEFEASHGGLHLDPRVRWIHDDGRSFLARTDERYDLVTSEPPPPLAAGVYRLYSTDYYRAARARLTEQGLMSQWLPLFILTPEAVEMVVSSFLEVFPHTLVFTGFGTDLVLVGSGSPLALDRLADRFRDSPLVAEDLRGLGVREPADLLARILQPDTSLRRRYAAARRIRDARNDLDAQLLDPRRRAVVPAEIGAVRQLLREQLATAQPEIQQRADAVLSHLGRLQYRVLGYPIESLEALRPADSAAVALGDVDWRALRPWTLANLRAVRRGRRDESIRALRGMLEVARDQPAVLLRLADFELERQEALSARDLLRRFVALEPEDATGRELLGEAHRAVGEESDALSQYQQAARLAPESPAPLLGEAWILATRTDAALRDPARALRLAARARERGASPASALEVEAAAYAAAGDPGEAARRIREALREAPEARADLQGRLLAQLARYLEEASAAGD